MATTSTPSADEANESASPFSPGKYYGNMSQGGGDNSHLAFADTGSPPFSTAKSHNHTASETPRYVLSACLSACLSVYVDIGCW